MPCSCKAGNACVSIYSLTFTNLHALWIIWVCCVLTEEGNSFSLGLNLLSSAVIMKSDPHPPTTTFCVHPPEGQHWNWYMQLHMAGLGNGWMRNKRVKSRGIIIIIINSQLKSAFYSYVNTWFKSFFFFFHSFFSVSVFIYWSVCFWIAEVLRRVVWNQAVCVLKWKTCMLAANMIRLQWKCSFWLWLVEMSHAYLGPYDCTKSKWSYGLMAPAPNPD